MQRMGYRYHFRSNSTQQSPFSFDFSTTYLVGLLRVECGIGAFIKVFWFLSKVVGTNFVCSKVVGVCKVAGTAKPGHGQACPSGT